MELAAHHEKRLLRMPRRRAPARAGRYHMPGVTDAPPPRRLPEIEALRGIAVAGVVLHHAFGAVLTTPHKLLDMLARYVDYGVGVDLFFAISGYVIARSLVPTVAACKTRRDFVAVAGGFWLRRAWRLLPSAWLWLAIILAASAWFNQSGLFGTVITNAWATLAGILDFANVRFAALFLRHYYGASFAWWSLSSEEQFYLLLPPACFLLRQYLAPLLCVLVLVQFPLPAHSVWLVVFRNQAILMGVLLALWEPRPSYSRTGAYLARLPVAVPRILTVLLLLSLGWFGKQGLTEAGQIGGIALISAALVYLAAQDRGLLLGTGAIRNTLVWVGARSYAIYLVHVPAFFATREIWLRLGVTSSDAKLVLTSIALIGFAAELNWRCVEQPLRAHGVRTADRFVTARAQKPALPAIR
jgi:peptidoglycan/LPS O-acetylase OafA/YrhL